MSTYWWAECQRCEETSESHNRRRDELVEACEASWALKVAMDAGWDVSSADRDLLTGDGLFFAEHAACNAFKVACEYGDESHPPAYPKVKGAPAEPCPSCSDRGFVPCPTCKVEGFQRIMADGKARLAHRHRVAE